MLTPDFLSSVEFNDVVNLYNQLNIDIMADIIKRISAMDNITSTSKKQLKILLQTNGIKIFNETLEKTLMLTADTKKALKEIFTDMAKEDIQGYKELYEYRNKDFKLSETQYKILNEGLKQTNKTLKNFTNTIAFQSEQAYKQAVDNAYMQAVTGGFDYTIAINNAVQELANKGITLKDKLGRNVQLEVAVRRNILSGIHQTANNINRDIEEYLGCDGYEVTAHSAARPGHAIAQGKQYAVNHKTKISQKYPLWSSVESLWSEYNCRHTYFGIILGISEPIYSKEELKKMKNETVSLNGERIPIYEATQKQRQIENEIRKTKRSIQILEKAKQDANIQKSKLNQLQGKYTSFCEETGLQKEYSRVKATAINKEMKNIQTKYEDITSNYTKTRQYSVKEQKYYEDNNKNRYNVDGKHVILEPTTREKEVANMFGKLHGGQVQIIPRVNKPLNVKTPDYIINNERFDLKQITGSGKYVIEGNLKGKKEQANNFIIDITKSELNKNEANKQIQNIYSSKHFLWVDKIFLIKGNGIVKIYKRK